MQERLDEQKRQKETDPNYGKEFKAQATKEEKASRRNTIVSSIGQLTLPLPQLHLLSPDIWRSQHHLQQQTLCSGPSQLVLPWQKEPSGSGTSFPITLVLQTSSTRTRRPGCRPFRRHGFASACTAGSVTLQADAASANSVILHSSLWCLIG